MYLGAESKLMLMNCTVFHSPQDSLRKISLITTTWATNKKYSLMSTRCLCCFLNFIRSGGYSGQPCRYIRYMCSSSLRVSEYKALPSPTPNPQCFHNSDNKPPSCPGPTEKASDKTGILHSILRSRINSNRPLRF